jgi:hypothetical protein
MVKYGVFANKNFERENFMQTETTTVAQPKKTHAKAIVISIVILAVFAALFALLLSLYNTENQSTVTQFMQDETSKSGYIEISAKSFSVDPVKGEISTRLQFTPNGDLLSDDGTLARDMTLYVNSSAGKTTIPFKKGELMNPTDVVLDIYGNVGAYPFDSHEGELYMVLIENVKDASGAVTDGDMIPFTVDYTSALAGYKVTPAQADDSDTGAVGIDLSISRAATALTFAICIMVLEWLLALSAVGAVYVWIRGRKIEVGMFGWMGALLFALVPLRNAMPAVPPVGVLSDVVAFFWSEIIVAVCLVVSVVTWIRRGSAAGNAK